MLVTNKLQRSFGILISSFLFLLFLINIYIVFNRTNSIVIFSKSQIPLLVVSFFMLVSIKNRHGTYIQVLILSLSALFTILFTNNMYLGVIQLIIIVLLSDKYNFFRKRLILKISIFLTVYLVCLTVYHIFSGISFIGYITRYIYFIIISISIILIKFEQIKITLDRERMYKEEIRNLHESLKISKENFKLIDTSYIDPLEAGLTSAEFELLRNLCLYKESNAGLANRLTKSVNTVKVQMKNILTKIGADSRHQLIDLCKNYFITNEGDR